MLFNNKMVEQACFKAIKNENVQIQKKRKELPLRVEKQKVGSGSYNIVYNAVADKRCKENGKKFIFRRSKTAVESFKLFKQEAKMAIKMSVAKAGPEIYNVGIDTKDRGFIVMEHYPHSLRQVVEFPPSRRPSWEEIEKGLRGPLNKMASEGVFCSDLKFRNVVLAKRSSGWVFKIIDFGEDFCAFESDLYLANNKAKKDFLPKNKEKMSKILYCSMLIMMSINSERSRKKFFQNKKPLFSKELKEMPLDVKIPALLFINKGKSNTGMRTPIAQARHYYSKPLTNANKIYEILTGETLKR
jgi:hypothetical protein|tara:strand:+ start:775 stop:1674 length:900 start_codon:yes stop_codon:yes gene_type:complete